MIELDHIDSGKSFDFGRTAREYAKYRDIYTESFYRTLLGFNIGLAGQNVLDLGTGTGVIPRHMARYGARWTGADISDEQIEMARILTSESGMDIAYIVCPADDIPVEDNSFDAVTACQAFWYFPVETTIPEIKRVLRPGGRFAIMYMIGLPRESAILAKSEELVLKFNPAWSGSNLDREVLQPPDWLGNDFTVVALHDYVEDVAFTRDGWCGRMRTCRGVGASLPPDLVEQYDKEHFEALSAMADETFTIPHQYIFQVYDVVRM